MDSLWRKTFQMSEYEALTSDIRTDVLIIGGGIAGLLCARQLADANVDYVLVEADRICSGITSDTTAKITSQHGLIYDRLIRTFGIEKAQMYLEANQQALRRYGDLRREIECDFIQQDAFVYSLNDRRTLDAELEALHKLGFGASFAERTAFALPHRRGCKIPGAGAVSSAQICGAYRPGAEHLRAHQGTRADVRPGRH